jgi:hypothetical protein
MELITSAVYKVWMAGMVLSIAFSHIRSHKKLLCKWKSGIHTQNIDMSAVCSARNNSFTQAWTFVKSLIFGNTHPLYP